MQRCAGCGGDFVRSRPQSAPAARVTDLQVSPSITSSRALPVLPRDILPPSSRYIDSRTTCGKGDFTLPLPTQRGWRTPRSCRTLNLLTTTGLLGTPLQSQALDPYLAECAKQRLLAMSHLNAHKPGTQPFRINEGVDLTSPKFARALRLWETNRRNRLQVLEDSKDTQAQGLPESVRQAKYLMPFSRESSPKNRSRASLRPQSAGCSSMRSVERSEASYAQL